MSFTTYTEDNISEFGVEHHWFNSEIETSIVTHRGTKVEIVNKPRWGLTCYMNNSIQSCVKDEWLYHESLVHPVMSYVERPKRVCIIGGGEGATLREVLKWPDVKEVDMYEWDRDVVNLFSTKYQEWSQGAFEDKRVVVIYDNIFDTIQEDPARKYDVIIIDLFEPDEDILESWKVLLTNVTSKWLAKNGSIVMYAGMRNVLYRSENEPYKRLLKILDTCEPVNKKAEYDIIPYKVYIPSFTGESMYILIKPSYASYQSNIDISSHITPRIWESYCTLNW